MINFNFKAENISKAYSRKKIIISDVNLDISNGGIVGIVGPNGSGKTTFLKIICGVLKPSSGKVELRTDGKIIKKDDYFQHFGYVAPYMNLYDEFTPLEHLKIFARISGINYDMQKVIDLLEMFNLGKKKNDQIRTFSSGMKQRMKYILAMQRDTELLLLDEPMTNLDSEGISSVHKLIKNQAESGGAVIIATNDERDKLLCQTIVDLSNKKF
jgi:heme exporter protein A